MDASTRMKVITECIALLCCRSFKAVEARYLLRLALLTTISCHARCSGCMTQEWLLFHVGHKETSPDFTQEDVEYTHSLCWGL
jgi:hypothetical protein